MVFRDNDADIAVLRPRRRLPAAVRLAKERPETGAPVYAVGQALGVFKGTIVGGMFSGEREEEGTSLYQHSAPLSSGMSGDPLLNEEGDVIGVNTEAIADNSGLNFAVPLGTLHAGLHMAQETVRRESRKEARTTKGGVIGKLAMIVHPTAIRKAAGGSSKILYRGKPGRYLVVLPVAKKSWLSVLMEDGTRGYVLEEAVEITPYGTSRSKSN